jgi:hypothetical protein
MRPTSSDQETIKLSLYKYTGKGVAVLQMVAEKIHLPPVVEWAIEDGILKTI